MLYTNLNKVSCVFADSIQSIEEAEGAQYLMGRSIQDLRELIHKDFDNHIMAVSLKDTNHMQWYHQLPKRGYVFYKFDRPVQPKGRFQL